jgi:uncharacterized MAPEG superfamily protein
MRKEQKIVAAGAASGVIVMIAGLLALSGLMPALSEAADAGERLAYAAKWNAVAVLPLFLAIASVANARFSGEAIDPTAGKESRAMIINGRVVDNSIQQYAIFVAATLALAAGARGDELGVIAAAALIFAVMRLAFWIGYRIDPLYRAFGMSSVVYLNLILLGLAGWMAWR